MEMAERQDNDVHNWEVGTSERSVHHVLSCVEMGFLTLPSRQ